MKAHRTDLVSFVFGLIFVGLALWWLLAQILGLALPAVGWFLAGALVLIGLLGLVGAVRSARNQDRQPAADAAPTTSSPRADAAVTDAPAVDAPAAGSFADNGPTLSGPKDTFRPDRLGRPDDRGEADETPGPGDGRLSVGDTVARPDPGAPATGPGSTPDRLDPPPPSR